MLDVDDRLDRAADILVEGLLRLLVAEGRVEDADVLPARDVADLSTFGMLLADEEGE